MNERIRELTVKALSSCNPAKMTSLSSSVDNGDGVDIPLEFSEKFAQLIMQECVEQVQGCSMNSGDEWEQGLVLAEEAIKEHFGVKS